MAITKMNKFTLVCFRKDKNNILKNLQKLGDCEFVNLQETLSEEEIMFLNNEDVSLELQDIEDKLSKIKSANRLLQQYTPRESAFSTLKNGKEETSYEDLEKHVLTCQWEKICTELKNKEDDLAIINSKINNFEEDISSMKPWSKLEIPISKIRNSANTQTFIGIIPAKKLDELKEAIEKINLAECTTVNSDDKNSYIVILSHKEVVNEVKNILKKIDFTDVKLPCRGLINEEINYIDNKINKLKEQRNKIVSSLIDVDNLKILNKCEEYFSNILIRLQANQNFKRSETSTLISGWNPVNDNKKVEEAIKEATNDCYILKFNEVEDEEELSVPIKLENNKFFSAFESITEMYSLPNYKGLDPTPLLAPFYMLFFGMMVGDFGYGLIITLVCILSLKLFKLDEAKKKFANLFMWLGISTTGWGLIYGAGFGDKIQFKSLLSLDNDIMTVMALSIGFGVIQILIALFIKAFILIKAKQYFSAFSNVGLWLVSFVGIAMFMLNNPFGKWIMISGMLGIVFTNGREAKNVLGKLVQGTYSLYGITNYIGDLVSYTRLMALGVAGGSIASAMNLIISYIPSSNILIKIVLIPMLFVAVHIFNLLLSVLGAYVHSCRLQYVEYFGKFYEGGGKAFKPLKMANKHIEIK